MGVLVCDDNRDSADTLAVVLRSHGHDVKVFYAGGACLREASEWNGGAAPREARRGHHACRRYGVMTAPRTEQ
jgi:CheY-like chemotaxis protein